MAGIQCMFCVIWHILSLRNRSNIAFLPTLLTKWDAYYCALDCCNGGVVLGIGIGGSITAIQTARKLTLLDALSSEC